MAWPGSLQTITTQANFIPELWAIETINAVEKNLVFSELVERWDSMVQGMGDTIHIPHVSNFTAKDKAASTRVDPQATTEGKTDIVIDLHKEVSFFVEDIAQVQANQDMRSKYTEKAGYAIALAMDSSISGLYGDASNTVSAGAAITWANLLSLRQYLAVGEAPQNDRFLVVNSYAINDMLNLSEIKDQDFINPAPGAGMTSVEGRVARPVLGFQVYESNNVTSATVSSTATDHNLAFQRGAFAMAVQKQPRVQAQYMQDYLATLVTIDVIYGIKTLRGSFAVDLTRTRAV